MFPASDQTVGYIPAGTQTADPANDPQLLSETEDHYWFQFDAGSGMQDADPLMAGATIGQTFTTSTGTFTEVPDALREKTEVQLVAEIYSQAAGLLRPRRGPDTTVLDQTFNDVDLVGQPLTIGNFVDAVGGRLHHHGDDEHLHALHRRRRRGEPRPEPGRDHRRAQPYQEVFTNFPFGSQVLTGLFLNIDLSGPQGPTADVPDRPWSTASATPRGRAWPSPTSRSPPAARRR